MSDATAGTTPDQTASDAEPSGETAKLLGPDLIAVSEQGRLTLGYYVPQWAFEEVEPNALDDWALVAVNSAAFAVDSGEAKNWASGNDYDGVDIVFLAPVEAPTEWAARWSEISDQLAARDLGWSWQVVDHPPMPQAAEIEARMAEVLRPLGNGESVLLWVTQVGTYRPAGVGLIDAETGDAKPYPGEPPAELNTLIARHKEAFYIVMGRAWLSFQIIVRPDGAYRVHPDIDRVLPWTEPVPEAAWAEEQEYFPNAVAVPLAADESDSAEN